MKSDAEVRRLMREFEKKSALVRAADAADMSPKTARKYRDLGKLPSELKKPRDWRTRVDPFEEVWPEVDEMLRHAPELQVPAIFEYLNDQAEAAGHECFQDGQLRTLYRRVKRWSVTEGPPKEVRFRQAHVPGEAMQTDFTDASELGITIEGVAFPHLLGHVVLPYSNWEAARVVRSESLLAIRKTVQHALFKLGRVPQFNQTDHSSAATHRLGQGARRGPDEGPRTSSSDRGFNEQYVSMMEHFGLRPRTTEVGEKEQNGDVEAANKALKNRLNQYLLLRRSRDFESVEAYEAWLDECVAKANRARTKRLGQELAVMRPLTASKLTEFEVEEPIVNKGSIVRVRRNAYSVPARLIGEKLRACVYDDRVEISLANIHQLTVPRLLGSHEALINYRHVIHSLVDKPHAFARYVYREHMYPTVVFRRAYDTLVADGAGYLHTLEYLRLLELAAMTMETEVEAAIELLLEADERPTRARVEELVGRAKKAEVPELSLPSIDLGQYDRLLSGGVA